MTRRSLRDRNNAAMALDPETPELEDGPQAEPPSPAGTTTTDPEDAGAVTSKTATKNRPPKQTAAPRKDATATGASATARLGIYLTPAEFDDAKAAYLTDWTNGGQADTFARWIAQAIDSHARRTPKQRADRAHPKGRADQRTGSTRSFSIPADTVARMRAAITADQQAGRWPSDSAWCGEAIALAVNGARTENGGTLPTPPARLPNRLVR